MTPSPRASHPCLYCKKARWKHSPMQRHFDYCTDGLTRKANTDCTAEERVSRSVCFVLKATLE